MTILRVGERQRRTSRRLPRRRPRERVLRLGAQRDVPQERRRERAQRRVRAERGVGQDVVHPSRRVRVVRGVGAAACRREMCQRRQSVAELERVRRDRGVVVLGVGRVVAVGRDVLGRDVGKLVETTMPSRDVADDAVARSEEGGIVGGVVKKLMNETSWSNPPPPPPRRPSASPPRPPSAASPATSSPPREEPPPPPPGSAPAAASTPWSSVLPWSRGASENAGTRNATTAAVWRDSTVNAAALPRYPSSSSSHRSGAKHARCRHERGVRDDPHRARDAVAVAARVVHRRSPRRRRTRRRASSRAVLLLAIVARDARRRDPRGIRRRRAREGSGLQRERERLRGTPSSCAGSPRATTPSRRRSCRTSAARSVRT